MVKPHSQTRVGRRFEVKIPFLVLLVEAAMLAGLSMIFFVLTP
jgi:hypothetical protein